MIGRLGAAEPLAGQGFELYAIASAIYRVARVSLAEKAGFPES
jgi:ABC-type xylose transport system permease subunit